MKTAYKRLNRDHRIEIEKQIALGKNNKQIAATLSVHPSTISRELKRVKNGPYDNLKAEVNYVHNLMDKRLGISKINSNPKLKNFCIFTIRITLVSKANFRCFKTILSLRSNYANLARKHLLSHLYSA